MASKRIMFIINNLGGGGAERVVSNLCKGMRDYEKYVIIFESIVEKEVGVNLRRGEISFCLF